MDNRQRIHLDSLRQMQDFNKKYANDLATIEDFPDEQKILDDSVTAINKAYVVQSQPTGTADVAIEARKKAMATLVNTFTMRAVVKAKRLGNLTLAAALDKPVSYILGADKTKSVAYATGLVDTMESNLDTLTSITAKDITAMRTAISAYSSIQGDAIENVIARKTGGTERLPLPFTNGREASEHIVMLVHSYFSTTNPEMVSAADAALELRETGLHHTQLDLDILDDDTSLPIANARLTDTSTHKEFTSALDGTIHIASHTSGYDSFTIEADGYVPFTFGITFQRGVASHFVARMRRK